MNQFILRTPAGEPYATLMDLPLTRAGELMLIGALRDGFSIAYESAMTTAHPHQAAAPVATKPSRVVAPGKPGRKQKRANASDPLAQRKEDYAIGDTVYLYWSAMEAKVQARMSQYRMTKGIVVEFQSGFRSIGVRFNGDPELIWLKRSEISRVPEVSG